MLIVLVIRCERLCNLIMIEQERGCTGVFAQHYIHLFQYFYGTKSKIGKIANRRWDKKKLPAQTLPKGGLTELLIF